MEAYVDVLMAAFEEYHIDWISENISGSYGDTEEEDVRSMLRDGRLLQGERLQETLELPTSNGSTLYRVISYAVRQLMHREYHGFTEENGASAVVRLSRDRTWNIEIRWREVSLGKPEASSGAFTAPPAGTIQATRAPQPAWLGDAVRKLWDKHATDAMKVAADLRPDIFNKDDLPYPWKVGSGGDAYLDLSVPYSWVSSPYIVAQSIGFSMAQYAHHLYPSADNARDCVTLYRELLVRGAIHPPTIRWLPTIYAMDWECYVALGGRGDAVEQLLRKHNPKAFKPLEEK